MAMWANPTRLINRIFFHDFGSMWRFGFVPCTPRLSSENGFFWLHVHGCRGRRLSLPSLAGEGGSGGRTVVREHVLFRGLAWLAATVCMMVVVFTPWLFPQILVPSIGCMVPATIFTWWDLVFSTILLLRGTVVQARQAMVRPPRRAADIYLAGAELWS